MSTISASTTSTTAYKVTADTTGALVFQTGASPTTAMTLGSDQSVTFAGTPTYSGGTANGVAYLNGSKVFTTGTDLVFDSTNLGVGTTSPTYRLTVVGATSDATPVANFRGYTTGTDGARTVIVRYSSSTNSNWANARHDAYNHLWYGNGSEIATLTYDGNLLVGASSNQTYFGLTTPKLLVKGIVNAGPASTGIGSSSSTAGGSLLRQTAWNGPASSITINYSDLGAIDNSGGMLVVTSTNKVSGAGGGVGTILLIWTKNSGGDLAITTVSSRVAGAITTISAAASGGDLVVTSNASSYFAWTSVSAG